MNRRFFELVRPRLRRSRIGMGAALVTIVVALALPVAAWAFQQTYAQSTIFHADGIALSSNGIANLRYNNMNWTSDQPPYPDTTGQTTLCNGACLPYDSVTALNGNIDDFRTIAVGRAKCHSAVLNSVDIFVNRCFTST